MLIFFLPLFQVLQMASGCRGCDRDGRRGRPTRHPVIAVGRRSPSWYLQAEHAAHLVNDERGAANLQRPYRPVGIALFPERLARWFNGFVANGGVNKLPKPE